MSIERSNGNTGQSYRSPDVVRLRPNTRQNGVAALTRDQHETTPCVTPLNLQNLDPRFKSGRRLQFQILDSKGFTICDRPPESRHASRFVPKLQGVGPKDLGPSRTIPCPRN